MINIFNKIVAPNFIFTLLLKVISIGGVFFTHILLARLYKEELMGAYLIGINFVMILSTFSRLGLDNGLLRFIPMLNVKKDNTNIRSLIYKSIILVLILSSIISVLLIINSDCLSALFNSELVGKIIVFLGLAFPFYSFMLLSYEILKGLKKFKIVALCQNFFQPWFLLFFLTLFFFVIKSKELSIGIAFLTSCITTCLVLLIIYINYFPKKVQTDNVPIKELIIYSQPIFWMNILNVIIMYSDVLILGYFRAPNEISYYTAALKTSAIVSIPLIALNNVIPPLIVEYYENRQYSELQRLIQISTRWAFIVAILVSSLICIFASEVLNIFGKNFEVGILALMILTIANLFNVGVGSVGYILMMTENQKIIFKLQLSIFLINIPLCIVMSNLFGFNGTAFTTAISMSAFNILMAWKVYKKLGIKTYAERSKKIIICGVFVSLSLLLVKHTLGNHVAIIGFMVFFLCSMKIEYFNHKKLI